ncbi:hypothetical protein ACFWJT_37905 [Streptomyces sp. NPDC127069]|uniref:hypothetical protein n=1 Tax=Streptomyces sp. NPDC127069 TaxID=3347128 RepID=UPI003657F5E8
MPVPVPPADPELLADPVPPADPVLLAMPELVPVPLLQAVSELLPVPVLRAVFVLLPVPVLPAVPALPHVPVSVPERRTRPGRREPRVASPDGGPEKISGGDVENAASDPSQG